MKEGSNLNQDTEKTLEKLITLMTARELAQGERDKLSEDRAAKTDLKIDTLTGAITTLTINHAESQRDNKEIFKTQERQEENQKSQGIKLSKHSEVLAVHEVKINNSKSIIREVSGVVIAIITAVIISVLVK